MKDQQVGRQYQHFSEREAEKRKMKELLKKSPIVTKDNLVQVNDRTWVLKKKGETDEQARERFLSKHPNTFYGISFNENKDDDIRQNEQENV